MSQVNQLFTAVGQGLGWTRRADGRSCLCNPSVFAPRLAKLALFGNRVPAVSHASDLAKHRTPRIYLVCPLLVPAARPSSENHRLARRHALSHCQLSNHDCHVPNMGSGGKIPGKLSTNEGQVPPNAPWATYTTTRPPYLRLTPDKCPVSSLLHGNATPVSRPLHLLALGNKEVAALGRQE